ncbi:hypothetical protein A7X67_04050 [Clostridium sp. W14A]|nr:hypothetical protein A7X67_04050 [Clostridium sp. W14A]
MFPIVPAKEASSIQVIQIIPPHSLLLIPAALFGFYFPPFRFRKAFPSEIVPRFPLSSRKKQTPFTDKFGRPYLKLIEGSSLRAAQVYFFWNVL